MSDDRVFEDGLAAALHDGPAAKQSLWTLFERSEQRLQPFIAIAIALTRDPEVAKWFKALPTKGHYANAKRLYIALMSTKPAERIDAIDKLKDMPGLPTYRGILMGLCLALEDKAPEVVERAALLLAKDAADRRQRDSRHHELFLPIARRAVERGVTAKARLALDAVVKKIPGAAPLATKPTIAGADVPKKPPRPTKPLGPSPHPEVTGNDDALVREIIANPDDDAPRLVLADRLMERGDPRGEFIRIQCTLTRLIEGPKGTRVVLRLGSRFADYTDTWTWNEEAAYTTLTDLPNRAELEARELQLYRKHKQWLLPYREFFQRYSWRRGFLYEVSGHVASFLPGAAALLAAHPVHVNLHDFDRKSIERFANTPLPGVRRLTVSGLPKNGVSALLGEHLGGYLEQLEIADAPFGDRGIERLAQESKLHGLRRLRLGGTDLTDAGISALLASPVLQQLEALGLSSNPRLTDAGIRELIRSSRLAHLRHVGFDAAQFDPRTVEALKERLSKSS